VVALAAAEFDVIDQMKNILIILFVIFLIPRLSFSYECFYIRKASNKENSQELESHGNCVESFKNGILRVKEEHLSKIEFIDDDLRFLILHENDKLKAFYISRDNTIVQTHYYDNGPDYFLEGLARVISNNKFGFIDEQLNIVIPPKYDFAFPFKNGLATVCTGCTSQKIGGHSEITGGFWGEIDNEGNIVTPLKYRKEEFDKNRN
jgi:hypothetical protein